MTMDNTEPKKGLELTGKETDSIKEKTDSTSPGDQQGNEQVPIEEEVNDEEKIQILKHGKPICKSAFTKLRNKLLQAVFVE